MNKQVEVFYAELLAADPRIAEHADAVKARLAMLLATQPQAELRPDFAAQLREKVLAEFGSGGRRERRLAWYIPAGAVAVFALMLVVAPGMNLSPFRDTRGAAVTQVAPNAFGSLRSSSGGDAAVLGSPEAMSSVAPTMPGVAMKQAAATNAVGGYAADTMMYVPVQHTLTYTGTALTLSDATVPVYQREKGLQGLGGAQAWRDLLRGLVDPQALGEAKVSSVSFSESTQYGYTFYFDAVEGMINVSKQWNLWPQQNYSDPLRAEEVPADAELVRIAEAFLQKYGIALQGYGAPSVDRAWQRVNPMVSARAEMSVYVPTSIMVTYPMQVDGQTVVDESGMPTGFQVSVDVRARRVDGAWGVVAPRFTKSDYAAEQRAERVLEILQQGGSVYPIMPFVETSVEQVTVEFGTPDRVLMRSWRSLPDGSGAEILVPGLRFPVLNAAAAQYWRDAVVIPLAAELLEAPKDMPDMRPMIEPAAAPLMKE